MHDIELPFQSQNIHQISHSNELRAHKILLLEGSCYSTCQLKTERIIISTKSASSQKISFNLRISYVMALFQTLLLKATFIVLCCVMNDVEFDCLDERLTGHLARWRLEIQSYVTQNLVIDITAAWCMSSERIRSFVWEGQFPSR